MWTGSEAPGTHGDADPIALADAARSQPARHLVRQGVELAESQALVPGNHGLDIGVQRAKGFEEQGQGWREVGDDRSALFVAIEDNPPIRTGDRGQHRVKLPVELAQGHPSLLGVLSTSPYEAATKRGSPVEQSMSLIAATVASSTAIAFPDLSQSNFARPRLLPAEVVQPRLPGRNLHGYWYLLKLLNQPGRRWLADMRTTSSSMRRWASSWAAGSVMCCSTTLPYYIDNPLAILKLWDGGMSFPRRGDRHLARHPLPVVEGEAAVASPP
jgi:hypothetical protein